MLPKPVLYYGQDKPLPEATPLRAGPLSLIYEAGDLRYIKLGEQELLRRVYVAVRDQNWGTVAPILSNIQMESGPDSFAIRYDVTHKQSDLDFAWQGVITGNAAGTITFTMTGQAHSTFQRNRIGFCILHPMACAGVPAKIEHVDGSIEEAPFPTHIARQIVKDGHPWPVAPFENMRALTHHVQPDLWAEVRFAGDVFEMEDQRNWTDASFKTYGTPLSLPFPATVEAGTEITQSIALRLHGKPPPQPAASADQAITVSVDSGSGKQMPHLGVGVASHGQPLTPTEIDRLRVLNLSHLRLDLTLSDASYKAKLDQATAEANALSASLEIALHLSDEADNELADLARLLPDVAPPVVRWLIFHKSEKTTTVQWVNLARQHLAEYDSSAQIGAGTNAYFTELNANPPPVDVLDVVAYSLNPQVHAFDNASLVETLEAQAATVESARQLVGNKPLIVSPVTLQPRFNPNATGPEPEPEPGQLPAPVDPRQMALFGAGWTLGSLKYLLESGLQSVTYYETTGWRGVMETEEGSPLPDKFQSIPGTVFPLYHLLADVGEWRDAEVIPLKASNTLAVDGLALRRGSQTRLIVANLTAQSQPVTIETMGLEIQIRYLDETNVIEAMQSPDLFRMRGGQLLATSEGKLRLDLRPYAVARIDTQASQS